MSAFTQDWLGLREPADRRARDAGLLAAVASHVASMRSLVVTDLGCGTGATLRALAPRLAQPQRWRLVDHDPALLARAQRAADGLPGAGPVSVEPLRANLRDEIEAVIALEAQLVTTSAFLDLVSAAWIDRLVGALARHRRPFYAALSYDGRAGCLPADPLDAPVLSAFSHHQRRDKGLGGALGPDAAAATVGALETAGFAVRTARADWLLEPHEAELQRQLVLGWHQAVAETGRLPATALDRWLAHRLAAVDEGRSRLQVGHLDLWAVPQPPG